MKTVMTPEIKRDHHTLNAKDTILGKLAVDAANKLRGKNKVNFVEHLDIGDYVTILNAKDVAVTGNKLEQKIYYRHSGYIGNLRETVLKDQLRNKPHDVIRHAIEGMLPKNRLRKSWISRLKFKDEEIATKADEQNDKESQ